MDPNEELVGADLMEHRIRHSKIGISRAISALSPLKIDLDDVAGVPPIGMNPGHEGMIDELQAVSIYLYIHIVIFNLDSCFLFQATEKMRRWDEYYERMTPKKISVKATNPSAVSVADRNNSVKNVSVFPRHLKQRNSAVPSAQSNETSFRTDRYVSRRDDPPTISSRLDNRNNDSNFAWVD